MKKFITFIAIFICLLFAGATYAQDSQVLVPVKKCCIVEDTEYELADTWITLDTSFVDGDSLRFTTYGVDGPIDYSFPITRIDRDGNKCTYRCNPSKSKEAACLTIYTETYHYNVYVDGGEPMCCLFTERYAILRKRTSYGHVAYKFQLD